MTELEQLKADLPRLRMRMRGASLEEVAAWSAEEKARISYEIRWCVDALTELDARIKAVTCEA